MTVGPMKFTKILPAAKALRFAQMKGRMDQTLRLPEASVIPIMSGTKTP